MRKFLTVWVVMMVIFGTRFSFCQNLGKDIDEKVEAIAASFLKENDCGPAYSVLQIEKQMFSDHIPAYLVRLKPTGFLIVSPESSRPVWAYSFKNHYGVSPDEQQFLNALIRDISMQKPVPEQYKHVSVEKSWGPFVQTLWGQVNCYDDKDNLINVTNYYTPHHYAAGCVAISLSLVLHYYTWPVNGTGSYQYSDTYGSSTGSYSANFENTYYQWDNMLDRYKYRSSTDAQRQSVGELVYHAAIALKTDFENNGSTSNVNRIPSAGEKFFRYSGTERTPSSQVFWQLLDSNMVHGIPVILAVKASNGAGHSIVCDGLQIDENGDLYYHLNMGWWGSSNGWYRIRDKWNAGGYTSITDGVFYFLPVPQLFTPYIKDGQKKVVVVWRYPDKANVQAFELQQKVNDGSWKPLSNTIQDTIFEVDVLRGENQYFRVRAKVAGRWPYDEWSNVAMVTMDDTGIPDNESPDKIVLAPNPVSGKLNIRFGKFVPAQIVVYNVYGKQVIRENNIPPVSSWDINVGSLPDGYYFLRLLDKENHVKIMKFVKH